MKVAQAAARYIELKQQNGYAFSNGQKLLRALCRRIGDMELSNITTDHISSYLNETDYRRIHWRAKYGILFHFFAYWLDRGGMAKLTMPLAKPKVRSNFIPYIFSRHQLHELLRVVAQCQNCRDHIDAQTMRVLVLLLYGTGSRTEEILGLRLNDVNLSDDLINIEGRGPRHRQIPIGQSIAEILSKYIRWRMRRNHRGGSFLVTKYDTSVNTRNAARYFEKIRQEAGIWRSDGASYQPRLFDLKHTFAVHRITSWIKNGADLNRMLPALAAYMGQSGLGSTERYLALTPVRFQKHLNMLSPKRGKFHWRDDQSLMTFLSSF